MNSPGATVDGVRFLEAHMLPYLLIFVRVSGIFMLTPLFNIQETPLRLKGWLAAATALVIYPFSAPHLPPVTTLDGNYILYLLDGTLVGITIGLVISIYFTAFLMAGEFYSIQIGFGILNVIDPNSAASIPILGQLKSLLGVMVFIIIGGHLMVFEALIYSFKTLPVLTLEMTQPLVVMMIGALREMFVIAFQMAAPVMGTIFMVELVMGIMSKVAPQMNIMVAGFQIKIAVGLFLVTATIPIVYTMGERLFERSFTVLRTVMGSLA